MKIQFLGHACLLIETQGKKILVDPYITANENANHVDIQNITPDYILITHAHQDHILDVEFFAQSSQTTLISNWEIVSYFEKKGIKGHPMNTGGKWNFDFGTLHCTLAHHSSSFTDGTYGGTPNGYVIESGNKKIYIAGDTSLFYDMKLIPDLLGELNLAILPIGDNFTMDYKQALLASDFLQCNTILGYHYDTFGFIKIDTEICINHFSEHHKNLILLPIGESINL